jgi:hypothetical protein
LIAIGREQHARLDLAEAIDHGACAKVRRARRPDRAQAGGREHGDDGLGNVWQEAGHAIAGFYARMFQPVRDAGNFTSQLMSRELPSFTAFVAKDDGDAVVIDAQ